MSPLTLLALLNTGLFYVETGSREDGLHYRCPRPLPTNNSDCLGSFPVGSSVVYKAGGILFGQYSSGRGVAVRYITRFELDGAASSPLPVGGPALLCVYCSSRSWEIKSIADAISRFEFQRFHQLAPYASPTATSVPPWVLDQLPVV